MVVDNWSLFGLALRTPRLEMRVPDLAQLAELGEVAAAGVHDPAVQPFYAEWTDQSPEKVARSVIQWQWGTWSSWQPENRSIPVEIVGLDGRREMFTDSTA